MRSWVLANRRGVDAGRDRVHHVGRRLLDNSSTGRMTFFELRRRLLFAFRAAQWCSMPWGSRSRSQTRSAVHAAAKMDGDVLGASGRSLADAA